MISKFKVALSCNSVHYLDIKARNFLNLLNINKVFIRDKCLISSFIFLLYRIYNIVLSLSFPCFSVAGSTVANCKPNSPQLATVEPTAAKRKN